MDKVLDKLGIYDLVAVLLSGICALGTTYISDELVFHHGLSLYINPENTAIFLILSYLVGTILQELGSIITKRLTNKKSKLLLQALDVNRTNRYISEIELRQIYVIVQTKLQLQNTPDIDTVYNFCKHCGGNSPQADKDQSIAAFSRSLALHFYILFALILVHTIQKAQYDYLFLSTLVLLIAFIFWFRSIRFYKLRYAKIIRQYYYTHISQNEEVTDTQNK